MNKFVEIFSGATGLSSGRVFTGFMVLGAFVEWMHCVWLGDGIWNPSATTVTIILGAMGNNAAQKIIEKKKKSE